MITDLQAAIAQTAPHGPTVVRSYNRAFQDMCRHLHIPLEEDPLVANYVGKTVVTDELVLPVTLFDARIIIVVHYRTDSVRERDIDMLIQDFGYLRILRCESLKAG